MMSNVRMDLAIRVAMRMRRCGTATNKCDSSHRNGGHNKSQRDATTTHDLAPWEAPHALLVAGESGRASAI
jgi:hypothetical protein